MVVAAELAACAQAQGWQRDDGRYWAPADPVDRRPIFFTEPVTVQPPYLADPVEAQREARRRARQMHKITKLRADVLKVYALAKLSGRLLRETNDKLATMPDEKTRKAYTKALEKQLKEEYEGQLRKLTLSQGKVLIKLIHRETNNSAYELIKEYRSGASAVFWQTLATLFGANLKNGYHPTTDVEDAQIEYIVLQFESGDTSLY
ncbi:MAG: DUF4294 domain-containing protein [Sphingobacteriia bacterium]|jgi:hypothetical protein